MKKSTLIFLILMKSTLTLFSQEDNQLPEFRENNQEPNDFDHRFFEKANIAKLKIKKITVESSLKSYEYNMHSGFISDSYDNNTNYHFNEFGLFDSIKTNNAKKDTKNYKYFKYDDVQNVVYEIKKYHSKLKKVMSDSLVLDSLGNTLYESNVYVFINQSEDYDSIFYKYENNKLILIQSYSINKVYSLNPFKEYSTALPKYQIDSIESKIIENATLSIDTLRSELKNKWRGDTCITYYVIGDTFLLAEGYCVYDFNKRKIAAGRYNQTEDKFEKGITYKYVFKDNLLKEIISASYENQSFAIMRSTYFDYKLDEKGRVIEQTDRYNYIKNFFFKNDRLVKMIHKDLKSDNVYTKIYYYQ
jgi:hypothetical protein